MSCVLCSYLCGKVLLLSCVHVRCWKSHTCLGCGHMSCHKTIVKAVSLRGQRSIMTKQQVREEKIDFKTRALLSLCRGCLIGHSHKGPADSKNRFLQHLHHSYQREVLQLHTFHSPVSLRTHQHVLQDMSSPPPKHLSLISNSQRFEKGEEESPSGERWLHAASREETGQDETRR